MNIGFPVIKPHLLARFGNVKEEIKLSKLFVSFLNLNVCKF